jgi:ABC-type molybdate transport system substrate-binding protein
MTSTAVTERPRSTAAPIVVGRVITSAASVAALITAFLAFLKSPVATAAIQARGMRVDERR